MGVIVEFTFWPIFGLIAFLVGIVVFAIVTRSYRKTICRLEKDASTVREELRQSRLQTENVSAKIVELKTADADLLNAVMRFCAVAPEVYARHAMNIGWTWGEDQNSLSVASGAEWVRTRSEGRFPTFTPTVESWIAFSADITTFINVTRPNWKEALAERSERLRRAENYRRNLEFDMLRTIKRGIRSDSTDGRALLFHFLNYFARMINVDAGQEWNASRVKSYIEEEGQFETFRAIMMDAGRTKGDQLKTVLIDFSNELQIFFLRMLLTVTEEPQPPAAD